MSTVAFALAALPTEPDEIAELFTELGIKGRLGWRCDCPVANYLKVETGLAGIEVTRTSVRTIPRRDRLPGHVSRFVDRFDSGLYPQIVAQLEDPA